MSRPKGLPKTGGRKKGAQNKVTTQAKEAFNLAFEGMGGVEALTEWGRVNQTEFYKLYARNIPQQVTGEGGGPLQHEHDMTPEAKMARAKAAARVLNIVNAIGESA